MANPTCKICDRSGSGIQFQIFNPLIKPFGTACVECETKLAESLEWLGESGATECDIFESGQVYLGLTEVLPRR